MSGVGKGGVILTRNIKEKRGRGEEMRREVKKRLE